MMTMSGSILQPPPPPHGGGPALPLGSSNHQHYHHTGTTGVGGGGGGGDDVPQRIKPEDAAQHITVSDPVQHADGLNKYTSYRVDVRPPNTLPLGVGTVSHDAYYQQQSPHFHQSQTYSAVLRRYSDFLWLYNSLHAERAGAIVPPIPEKQPVGRFSPAFVEDRRVHLERFLRRVAVHPELADAVCLDTFLRADDVTFHAAKNAKGSVIMASSQANFMMPTPPNATTSNKKDGLKRWFAEAKTSMTGDLVKSPDDDLFEEISRYVHGLDNQMRNVSQQAASLVRKGKEIANGLFEFGLAFNLLGQSEADTLGDALCKMGETADRLSVLSAEHAEQEMAQFEEPLQDYIKQIHAVKLALQRRHEKRLTYSTCIQEVDSKQQQLGKLQAQIGSEAKAYAAEMSLRRAREAADSAREDFATVSQRLLREVDRFKRDKAEDMRRTVLDYIQLQVEYNRRMEEIWGLLIPRLEQVQLDQESRSAVPPPGQATASVAMALPTSPPRQQPRQQGQQQPFGSMMAGGGGGAAPPPFIIGQQPPQQQVHQPAIHQTHHVPQYDNAATSRNMIMGGGSNNNIQHSYSGGSSSSNNHPIMSVGGNNGYSVNDPGSISVQYRDATNTEGFQ